MLSLFNWNDTYMIMVGCRSCTCPSIRTETCALSQDRGRLPVVHTSKHLPSLGADSQDRGRLPVVHVSKHSRKNLHTCWDPWSTRGKTGESLKTSRLATKHCEALRRNHLVSTLFEAIAMKKRKSFVAVWVPGTGGQDVETRPRARTYGTTDT